MLARMVYFKIDIMRNQSILILLFALLLTGIYSCEETTDNSEMDTPFEYYPLSIGKFVVYTVDSINYHETIPNDTVAWEIKEILVDTFYDLNQHLNYTIERYRREPDSVNWNITNVWSVLAIDGQIQKVENNLRFIKLITPVKEQTNWAGNVYLGGLEDIPVAEDCNQLDFYEDWEYTYKNVGLPYSLNGFNFDNTIKVIQEGDSNLIWFDYAEEIYAENVGLIQQDFYHYYTQDLTCPSCPWTERVECGYSVKLRIIDFN